MQALRKLAGEQGCDVIVMSAQVEAELNELEEEEAREYLEALALRRAACSRWCAPRTRSWACERTSRLGSRRPGRGRLGME